MQRQTKRENREQTPPKLFAPLAVGFLIGGVTVGTALLVWNHDHPSRSSPSIPTYGASATMATAPQPMPTLSAASPAVDPAVKRVAERFVCSCGTCGEKSLEICSCEMAGQERAFIEEQLRNGHTEAEAADALNKKYGGLKPVRS